MTSGDGSNSWRVGLGSKKFSDVWERVHHWIVSIFASLDSLTSDPLIRSIVFVILWRNKPDLELGGGSVWMMSLKALSVRDGACTLLWWSVKYGFFQSCYERLSFYDQFLEKGKMWGVEPFGDICEIECGRNNGVFVK